MEHLTHDEKLLIEYMSVAGEVTQEEEERVVDQAVRHEVAFKKWLAARPPGLEYNDAVALLTEKVGAINLRNATRPRNHQQQVMSLQRAREWVGKVWCEPKNAGKEMDGDLAEAMARLLSERVNEAVSSSKFMAARAVMAEAFASDEGLRIAYVANVAMLLADRFNGVDFRDFEPRNQAAVAILDLIFAG